MQAAAATSAETAQATAAARVSAAKAPTSAAAAQATAAATHAAVARRYLIAAAGCALFAFIYAQFSHGVYSPFMTFMFGIPLVGGAAVAMALSFAKAKPVPPLARQSWALALATLTIGSCLRGIFEIAGTSSPYLVAYPIIAAAFAAVAVFSLMRPDAYPG